MRPGIRRRNPEWDRDLIRLMRAGNAEVAVGFPRGRGLKARHYKDGSAILEVAVWNNFGAPNANIPPRPFMQQATPKIVEKINEITREAVRLERERPFSHADLRKLYNVYGMAAKVVIQEAILTGDFVPNAPSTIRRKKSSRPLIDSGDMRAAVQFAVRDRE
jgi:hypothetical protein